MATSYVSARETGMQVSLGVATAEEFPSLTDSARNIVPNPLLRMVRDLDIDEFKLDRRFMPGISDLALTAELVEIPEHAKTREESAHQVFFGQLLLHGEDEGEHSLHVAVKPFPSNKEACKEYAVASHIAEGNVPQCETFRPLGITRLQDGLPAVISHYRHSVRSMDGIFWDADLVQEAPIVDKALGRAGVALALLHAGNWVHGDYQAKNAVWDVLNPYSSAFVADLETAKPLAGLTQAEKDELKYADVETFATSVFQLQEDTESGVELPADFAERVKLHFGLMYVSRQQQATRTTSSLDVSTVAEIVDRVNW